MSKSSQVEEKWSSKKAKKAGQQFRREAANIFAEYQRDLADKLDEVRVVIRKRPRWIPKEVWLFCSNIFIDLSGSNKAIQLENPSDFLIRKHKEAVAKQEKEKMYEGIEMQVKGEESNEIEDLIEEGLSTPNS